MDEIGQVVGGQRLLSKLGQGGMGAVYKAEDETLGRPTVVKMLLPKFSHDRQMVGRFFQEAKAASAIRHPGIVKIHSFGYRDDDTAFIVMELLRGESLENRLQRQRHLPATAAVRIATQIASALGAAHEIGIIHRDLKPDNVFLVSDSEVDGGERAKLLDFGIAKVAPEEGALGVKTRTGMVMGTPSYMAPEQCRGASNVDRRTDLYALGCILYRMLCGRPPFVGPHLGEIIAGQLRDDPPALRTYAPTLDPALEALVLRLLQKQPDQRFADASELRAALDALELAGDEQYAHATSIPPPLVVPVATHGNGTQTNRGRRHLVVAGFGVVALGSAIGILTLLRDGAPDQIRVALGDCSDGPAPFVSGPRPLEVPGGTLASNDPRPPSQLIDSPLSAQTTAFARCVKDHYKDTPHGVAVLELVVDDAHHVTAATVLGQRNASLRRCFVAALPETLPELAKGGTLRCPIAFGSTPPAEAPRVHITRDAITLDGREIIDTPGASMEGTINELVDSLKGRVRHLRAEAIDQGVAIVGPWQICPEPDTTAGVLYRVLASARKAGADVSLTARRSGAWRMLVDMELPAVPVPVGAAQVRSPFGMIGDGTIPARTSVLITESELWLGGTHGDRIQIIDRPDEPAVDSLLELLADYRTTPELKAATYIEIGAEERVSYRDLVAVIEIVTRAGFRNWVLAHPHELSVPFKL